MKNFSNLLYTLVCQTEFERRFGSHMYRYRWLQKLLFVPATSDGKIVESLQRRTRKYNKDGSKKQGLMKRIMRLNKITMSPQPMAPQVAGIVGKALRPDIQHLSGLLDRDLSHWIKQ